MNQTTKYSQPETAQAPEIEIHYKTAVRPAQRPEIQNAPDVYNIIVRINDKLMAELNASYLEGKEYILKALADNGYETLPSEGCYVCIKPKHKTSREITDLLQENGILILCGKQGLTGWLRLTIAHKQYMEKFMETLLKIDKE